MFGVLWTTVYVAVHQAPEALQVDYSGIFENLIMFNIISFFVVYKIVASLSRRTPVSRENLIGFDDDFILQKYIKKVFYIWIFLYLLTILYSGGLPIVWIITGSGHNYTEFGVPTLSGLLNMMRGFVVACCILLYTRISVPYIKKKYMWLMGIMFLSSLAEISRGNMIVLLLEGVAMLVIANPIRFKSVFRVVFWTLCFILAFGFIGDIRNEGSGGGDLFAMLDDDSVFNALPAGAFWVYLYLVTPFINIEYAISQGINPSFSPYYSIQTLIPSVLRDYLFVPGVYPIQLKIEAFNATSFYSPLIADFGVIAAAVIVLLIQVVVSYIHVRAVRGSVFHLFVYPAFYMSVVLSVFYMYFLSLITVLSPFLAFAYLRYKSKWCKAKRGVGSVPPVR